MPPVDKNFVSGSEAEALAASLLESDRRAQNVTTLVTTDSDDVTLIDPETGDEVTNQGKTFPAIAADVESDRVLAQEARDSARTTSLSQVKRPFIDFIQLDVLNDSATGTQASDRALLVSFCQDVSFTGAEGRDLCLTRVKRKEGAVVRSFIYIYDVDTSVRVCNYTSDIDEDPPEYVDLVEENDSGITGRMRCDWTVLSVGQNVALSPVNLGVPFSSLAVDPDRKIAKDAEDRIVGIEEDVVDNAAAIALVNTSINNNSPVNRVYGRIGMIKEAFSAGRPLVVGSGDSYVTNIPEKVWFQLRKLMNIPRASGVYISKRKGAQPMNEGGWNSMFNTGNGETGEITFADGYEVLSSPEEHMGLPIGLYRVLFDSTFAAGSNGRFLEYRFQGQAMDGGDTPGLLTNDECANGAIQINARLIGFVPDAATVGAISNIMHNESITLHDRLENTSAVATVNVGTGSGLPDGMPIPGEFFKFPTVVLDNPASITISGGTPEVQYYRSLRLVVPEGTNGTPDSDKYLFTAGTLLTSVDRTEGPIYATIGDGSMSYEGWAKDEDPLLPDDKWFKTDDLTSWLAAVRVNEDQELVVTLHLNNENGQPEDVTGDGSTEDTPKAREIRFRRFIERFRARWISAASDAGYSAPKFFIFHGFMHNGVLDPQENENLRAAIEAVSAKYLDTAFISLYELTEGVFLNGNDFAVDLLSRYGREDLAGAPYNGDILDGENVHTVDDVSAGFFASLVADIINA